MNGLQGRWHGESSTMGLDKHYPATRCKSTRPGKDAWQNDSSIPRTAPGMKHSVSLRTGTPTS